MSLGSGLRLWRVPFRLGGGPAAKLRGLLYVSIRRLAIRYGEESVVCSTAL